MCIIGIAHLATRRYPLIVAANRDERHARPTAPADWWADRPEILSGRDLVAGGTWLGVNTDGRFAAVTNVFDGAPIQAPLSRGTLVGSFLASTVGAARYLRAIEPDRERYGPYNLLVLDDSGLRFASNRQAEVALGPGIHAFSNNRPGTDWPKVELLGEALRASIDGADDAPAEAGAVPTRSPAEDRGEHTCTVDALAAKLIAMLSGPAARGSRESAPDSLFIVGREFGTRCSTVLIVDAGGQALFVERSFAATGVATATRRFAFAAPAFAPSVP